MATEAALQKPQIISTLSTLSPHGKLEAYLPMFGQLAAEDPDFLSHLIVWNHVKGEIRDSKAALPVIMLAESRRQLDDGMNPTIAQFMENAWAHLADTTPLLLRRALEFGKGIGLPKQTTHRFVTRYLRDLEANPAEWERVALQHKASLTWLYGRFHVSRSDRVGAAFGWKDKQGVRPPRPGKFAVVRSLALLSPLEIAGQIDKHKLPWLVVRGALGARIKEPDVLMALIGRMSAADASTSAKWLVRAGINNHPQTRAAFEELLAKAGKKGRAKGTQLKAKKAAKALADVGEEKTAGKLTKLQQTQVEHLRTIEGNWLIIGDKSGSMSEAIVMARQVAALLGATVKGHVYLVFADTLPRPVGDVTGKSLEAIEMTTAAVTAGGGTSLGCALKYASDQGWKLDGIAVVSDGAENTYPTLVQEYQEYRQKFPGARPTVYWYRTNQDNDPRSMGWIRQFEASMHMYAGMTTYDLRSGAQAITQVRRQGAVDDYALPQLIQTMRVGSYSLVDEIMRCELRTIDQVLDRTVGVQVVAG
jgi:hypothetical protein